MSRTARAGFRHAMGRDPGKVNPFQMPVSSRTPVPLPPAALFHYWHPEREGVEHCPKEFDRPLKLVHPGLYITRPPSGTPKGDKHAADQRWIVWQRNPSTRHPLCPGWSLLFLWPPRDYEPIPLDNRIFANLAIINPLRYKGGIDYFNRVIAAGMEKDAERNEAAQHQYRHDRRKDYIEATKIKNIGKGNKFALFHDGGTIPSRGEENWLHELGAFLPADVIKADLESRRRPSGARAPVGVDQHKVAQYQFDKQVAEMRTQEHLKVLIEERRLSHKRSRVGGGSR